MAMSSTMKSLQFQLALLEAALEKSIPLINRIYEHSEDNEDSLSFFFPYYQHYFHEGLLFKPIENESILLAPFRTYDHPIWNDWEEIWNASPLQLDVDIIPDPTIEFTYQSALFRLHLDSAYFMFTEETRWIRQGTTITFKGFNHEDVRFVVEWLQRIDEYDAYLKILKIVAMTSNGSIIPYSDPDYPSFILIVPSCLVRVPTPSPDITIHHARLFHLIGQDIGNGEDIRYCFACGNAF
jgi:hypothetical protein